ncbi:unnamed protein product [Vicia faba]|uniref:Uncharacterized protein n=1 Tax=Vicia faba TaxID=3906 RepID=A0AAV0YT05_VICFA|nr:unnamed protein product [Vicia faba]
MVQQVQALACDSLTTSVSQEIQRPTVMLMQELVLHWVMCRFTTLSTSLGPFRYSYGFGMTMKNIYYVGLKFTSPTYSCAISNILHDLEKACTRISTIAFFPSRDTETMECQAVRMDTEGEG